VKEDNLCEDCIFNMKNAQQHRIYAKDLQIPDWDDKNIAKAWKKASLESQRRLDAKCDKYGNYHN
jgi:hypothetical protein